MEDRPMLGKSNPPQEPLAAPGSASVAAQMKPTATFEKLAILIIGTFAAEGPAVAQKDPT